MKDTFEILGFICAVIFAFIFSVGLSIFTLIIIGRALGITVQ